MDRPRLITERRLNERQRLFVQEFLVDFDSGQAYIRAGYDVEDDETARSAANRLLQNVAVQQAINESQRERLERLKISGDWLVESFLMVYLDAATRGDRKQAIAALQEIGKLTGSYHEDNRQRSTAADLESIRARLQQRGIDAGKTKALPGET